MHNDSAAASQREMQGRTKPCRLGEGTAVLRSITLENSEKKCLVDASRLRRKSRVEKLLRGSESFGCPPTPDQEPYLRCDERHPIKANNLRCEGLGLPMGLRPSRPRSLFTAPKCLSSREVVLTERAKSKYLLSSSSDGMIGLAFGCSAGSAL